MKNRKNILLAFLLNLAFAVFECVGGILTGSVAIASDAVHDLGDAVSIGAAYLLEKRSERAPDERHTYGYRGYSVIGGVVTTLVLVLGSLLVIGNAVARLVNPVPIHYRGMLLFAALGLLVNTVAALITRRGDSLNVRAVNLHMLEDVLGWAVVLIGAIVMRFTDLSILDPLMSIGVALFILIHAVRHLWGALSLLLFAVPRGVDVGELGEHLAQLDGVRNVHHVHVWSMDGVTPYATLHVVASGDAAKVRACVREVLCEHGIRHATIEMEQEGETCGEQGCQLPTLAPPHHHHHG